MTRAPMPASPLLRSGDLNLQALLSSGELNLQAYNDAGTRPASPLHNRNLRFRHAVKRVN